MTFLLKTDLYQISMACALILLDKGDIIAGFEGFYRHPKEDIGKTYIFYGEKELKKLLNQIDLEVGTKVFVEEFMDIIKRKKMFNEEQYKKIENYLNNCSIKIEYSIYKNDCIIPALVPAIQVKTNAWLGLLIETLITNTYNGKTGYNTALHYGNANEKMLSITKAKDFNERDNSNINEYIRKLELRAEDYRDAAKDKILTDASFRRAPSYRVSLLASKIALRKGFNATSHVGLYEEDKSYLDKIGGTMAHAFVMLHETEEEAFINWNKIYPNGFFLVDTYNTINAIHTLIKLGISPAAVRIDSGDFFELVPKIREILNEAGLDKTKIYISGDITPEMLRELISKNIPFDIAMVGTKYVNIDEGTKVNCGFVYKIVEVLDGENKILPEKKAEGKKNYPGLKTVDVIAGNVMMTLNNTFGLKNLNLITENSVVIYEKGV